MKVTTATILAAALAAAGCGSSASHPGAAPTVTRTQIQTKTRTIIRWRTRAVTVPAPTITRTVYSPAPQKPAAAPSPSGANQIIVRFSGTGTQNTPTFTTPASWHLSWAYYDCPAGQSNFIVTEYNADGSLDPNGISVNELGTGRGPVASYAYGDAGRHYLSVNTEGCHWSLVPVTG